MTTASAACREWTREELAQGHRTLGADLSAGRRASLCAASGALYGASFAALPGAGVLAWVALAPLFVAATGARPAFAVGAGLIWGLSMGVATAYWLPNMLTSYFGASGFEAWAGLVAVALSLVGTYGASFTAGLAWFTRARAASPLVVGAGWAVCEWARANLLIPNPWALTAYSQADWSAFAQGADLLGPYGLAFLIAAANACVAAAIFPALRPQRFAMHVACVALLVAGSVVYGQARLAQEFATGPAVRVALVQGNIARGYDAEPTRDMQELDVYLELSREAALQAPSLVVWPEGAVDIPLYDDRSLKSAHVFRLARELGSDLLLGGPRTKRGQEGVLAYNSMFLLRDGRRAGSYEKTELMPFSETNPLRDWIRIGTDRFSAGQARLLRARDLDIGTLICSEGMLPHYARAMTAQGAQVLVNPSNDYWFGSRNAARLQLAAARFRAIENRRYLARPTSTGYSAIVDAHGRVTARSGFGTREVLTGTVRTSAVPTAYQKLGDEPVAWTAALLLVLAFTRPLTHSPRGDS